MNWYADFVTDSILIICSFIMHRLHVVVVIKNSASFQYFSVVGVVTGGLGLFMFCGVKKKDTSIDDGCLKYLPNTDRMKNQ